MPPVREKRRVDTRDKRETTRDCRGTSSPPRLASSSAASFPERNECPGTHCSLIEQEEKEDSSCQRIGWRGQNESPALSQRLRCQWAKLLKAGPADHFAFFRLYYLITSFLPTLHVSQRPMIS